jgi:2-dehydro-3-deoxygluconokinase
MGARDLRQERAESGSLLPTRAREDGSRPAMAALGEGLLEVGIEPELGSEVLGRGFGGDAANVAVMAALSGQHGAGMAGPSGVRSYLLTQIGDDAGGRLLVEFWTDRGVDVSRVAVDDQAPTGLYINDGLASGGHKFEYYRSGSAASRLGPDDIDHEFIRGLDLLHVTGITLSISESAAAAARCAMDSARAAGVTLAFDVNFRPQLGADPGDILAIARRADVVLLANADAEAVIGTSEPEKMLAALGPTPREIVVTRGASPALLFTREAAFSVEPPAVEVVNSAGAGDAVAGSYLASRLQGVAPEEALVRAVVAASLSCGRSGCARGYPSAEEVARRARESAPAMETDLGRSAVVTTDE